MYRDRTGNHRGAPPPGTVDVTVSPLHQFHLSEQVNVHEAKTRPSELLARVECGNDIVIARGGVPVAIGARPSRAPQRR